MNTLNRQLLVFGFALWVVLSLVKLQSWTQPRRIGKGSGATR